MARHWFTETMLEMIKRRTEIRVYRHIAIGVFVVCGVLHWEPMKPNALTSRWDSSA